MSPIQTRETHLSWLVLLEDRVYKVKKPVRTEFVDLSTREARQRNAEDEVRLNRRLAPDVYLGVATLAGLPGLDEPVVVMRRMPEDRRLALLAARGDDLAEQMGDLARRLATFHLQAPVVPRAGSSAAVLALWEAGRVQLGVHGRGVLDPERVEQVAALGARYVTGRPGLFDGRADRVREGHGDLLADDVFLLDDGPRVLDCLEFDLALRAGDVLSDVAFLAMDLEHLGRADLAEVLLRVHRAEIGDDWPPSLADHWVAYRAWVRAKVACLRVEQGGAEQAAQARDLLDLAVRRIRRATVRLVLIGGAPGTGKSTLAAELRDRTGCELLRSDVVRKELAGLEPTASATAAPGEGLYAPEATQRTLEALLRRARELLVHGRSVILDASWASPVWREAADDLARECEAEQVRLCAVIPDEVADARLRARTGDASDATPEAAAWLRERFAPWPQAREVATDRPPAELADELAGELLHT